MTTARASTRGARATRAVARATNARGTGVGTARRGRPRKEIARGDADGVRELLATIEVRFPEVVASGGEGATPGGGGTRATKRGDDEDDAEASAETAAETRAEEEARRTSMAASKVGERRSAESRKKIAAAQRERWRAARAAAGAAATSSLAEIAESSTVKNAGTAQRYANDLANELPEADVIVGFENYANLPKTVGGLLGVETNGLIAPQQARVQVGGASPPFREEIKRLRITPRHTAYLRVAEGCDHKCTFCAIPSFRGRFRSKPWQSIIDEAKALADSGVRELNLIAEDTNQWGIDLRASDGRGLAELLYALAEVEGIEWMRILYAYPSYFSDELIRAIADVPQVCKYIDIPLQHITNLSLLRMNRPPRQHTEDLLYKLRDRIPDLALRTTFISGFPGETEEEHEELMQFCRDFKFERLGAFAYSEEDGTPAMEYPDQVPEEIRAIRRDQLVSQQQEISEDFAMSRVGKDVDVLIDNWDEDMQAFIGRTTLEAPDIDPVVFVTEDKSKGLPPIEPGQMRRCNVIGSSLFDLEAQPIM